MRAHFNPVSLWMRGVLQEEFGVPVRALKFAPISANKCPDGSRRIGWTLNGSEGEKIEDALLAR